MTRIGQAMIDVASIGLIQERSLRQHETVTGQLQAALDSRVLIEQAKGVLAERRGSDPGEAFTLRAVTPMPATCGSRRWQPLSEGTTTMEDCPFGRRCGSRAHERNAVAFGHR